MTIKEFLTAEVDGYALKCATIMPISRIKEGRHSVYSKPYFSKKAFTDSVDCSMQIIKFDVNIDNDGEWWGYIFYVSDNDYARCKKVW